MRIHDFYGLPRSIQDRFIESSQGAAAPVPLGVSTRSEKKSLIWGLSSLACTGAWAGFYSLGFGDLSSGFALGTLPHRLIHITFGCAASLCAMRAYALSWAAGRLPYATGDFLFPSGVVQARVGELTEHDAREMTSAKSSGRSVSVTFPSGAFQFTLENPGQAEKAVSAIEEGAEKWKSLSEADSLERARLNALIDSGVPNPLAPTQPHPKPQFLSQPIAIGIALVLGVGIGFGVSAWRDSMSQKALYKAAIAADTVEGYSAYLKRGGDRDEVATLLLPRAELKRAIEAGTVSAITAFFEKHPDTKIGGEVQNALRAALLKELEKAKKPKTVTALAKFEAKYKKHSKLVAAEALTARRAVFADAMASFQKAASNKDEALVPFVQQLLTYAETHGPKVQLRMSHVFKQNPEKLDKIVSKSKKYYMGRKSLPTQYFLGDPARRREKKILESIQKRLQSAFPKDILSFELVPLPKGRNEELGAAKVPTLSFSHEEKLSGGFVGGRPKAMYMGATVVMKAQGSIPDSEAAALDFTWSTWKNPTFSILADPKKDIPDVYELMLGDAYQKFTDVYLKRWFSKP